MENEMFFRGFLAGCALLSGHYDRYDGICKWFLSMKKRENEQAREAEHD
jgi:hypothetical protein